MKLIPYKVGSASAKALAEALDIKRIRQEGPQINLRGQTLINWGCSNITRQILNADVLNKPEAIQKSVNKLTAFQCFEDADVDIPEFTTSIDDARSWINDGKKVVCRTKLSSYGGEGIVIAERADQLVEAPLYVKYIPKEQEYRVHVLHGNTFFAQRKARKLEVPDDQVNWQVRNLAGGFIYANQNVEISEEVRTQSVAAVSALGLDFGAVDVVVTQRGRVYVLEVNTACGLQGLTLTKYVEAFTTLNR